MVAKGSECDALERCYDVGGVQRSELRKKTDYTIVLSKQKLLQITIISLPYIASRKILPVVISLSVSCEGR